MSTSKRTESKWQARIERQIAQCLERIDRMTDPELAETMRYALSSGGKRIRPVLMYLAADAFGVPPEAVDAYALGLELIHNYSLVHDDMPEMDNDVERRGKPTVHAKFGAGKALLCGDALLNYAYETMAEDGGRADLILMIARAAGIGGMIGGQSLDVADRLCTEEAIFEMYRKKTGALISVAVALPAKIAGIAAERVMPIADAAGLIFQLVDDCLDFQDGRDIAAGKVTFATRFGYEAAAAEIRRLDEEMSRSFSAVSVAEDSDFAVFLKDLTHRII